MLLSIPSACLEQRKWHPNERKITINGLTKNLAEWCKFYGKDRSTVLRRVASGMTIEQALTTPPLTKQEAGRLAAQKRWGKAA